MDPISSVLVGIVRIASIAPTITSVVSFGCSKLCIDYLKSQKDSSSPLAKASLISAIALAALGFLAGTTASVVGGVVLGAMLTSIHSSIGLIVGMCVAGLGVWTAAFTANKLYQDLFKTVLL